MKAFKMLMMAALTIVSVSLFAQDSTKQKSKAAKQKMEMMKYSCPMKCEGDKTYDKAGKCPKCGMDLKEKEPATMAYSCPMKCEGDKTYDKPGTCPKCGMALKEQKDDHSNHKH